MSKVFKQSIAAIIIITAMGMFYFGAYLPLKKSQLYIDAAMNLSTVHTIGDFDNVFKKVFSFYSPTGQDEILSAYISNMLNLIISQKDERVVDALMVQLENNSNYLFNSKNGFNYGQSLFFMGLIYEINGKKFNDEVYYQKAISMFEKGLEYSPNRPAFLYGLFDAYKDKGDKIKAKEIGNIILKYWPNDEEVKNFVKNN